MSGDGSFGFSVGYDLARLRSNGTNGSSISDCDFILRILTAKESISIAEPTCSC